MNKKFFFRFLFLFSFFGGVCSSSEHVDDLDPRHIACIKILPVKLGELIPDKFENVKDRFNHNNNHFARYASRENPLTETNEYGLGVTFEYANSKDKVAGGGCVEDLEAQKYLMDLENLSSEYVGDRRQNRNLLFTRVSFTLDERDRQEYLDCYMGLFVSGEDDYKYLELDALCTKVFAPSFKQNLKLSGQGGLHKYIAEPLEKDIKNVWKDNRIKKLCLTDTLKKYSTVGNYSAQYLPPGKEIVYYKKVLDLRIGGNLRFFGPRNTRNVNKPAETLEQKVKKRLYHGLLNLSQDHSNQENNKVLLLGEINGARILFGNDNDFGVKEFFLDGSVDIYGKVGDTGSMFAQSEQAFLGFLDTFCGTDNDSSGTGNVSTRSLSNLYSLFSANFINDLANKAAEKGASVCLSPRIQFFSLLDICKYCRGTLSVVIENGYLGERLQSLLKTVLLGDIDDSSQFVKNSGPVFVKLNHLKERIDQGDFLTITSPEVLAFSYKPAKVGIAAEETIPGGNAPVISAGNKRPSPDQQRKTSPAKKAKKSVGSVK